MTWLLLSPMPLLDFPLFFIVSHTQMIVNILSANGLLATFLFG